MITRWHIRSLRSRLLVARRRRVDAGLGIKREGLSACVVAAWWDGGAGLLSWGCGAATATATAAAAAAAVDDGDGVALLALLLDILLRELCFATTARDFSTVALFFFFL
jgi:hypothetical protein